MNKVEHIIGMVRNNLDDESLKRQLTEFLEPDYIPKGIINCPMYTHGLSDIINVKLATPGMRCCTQVGDDLQSGPLYCGKPAYLYGESKNSSGAFYIFCQRHANRHGIKL